MDIKTKGFDMPNGDRHIFIPPSPTESERGGIKAKRKTTENVEVAVGDDDKLYVPPYPTSLPASDVSEWAKQPTKPSYNADEVGALPDTTDLLQLDSLLEDETKAANAKVTGDKITSLKSEKVDKAVLLSIINNKPTAETLDDFLNLQRNDKIYQVKIPKFASNPSSTCEKLGANEGLVFEPSTDTVEGRDDYIDKIEFMWWHNNYVRGDDTYPIITALEGDENYAETGSVDVGSCGMSFYYKYDTTPEDHIMLTWSPSPHEELGLIPFSANVPGHAYWCLSAYPSVIASDGLLRSQPNGKVARNQSYNNMIANYQKKGKGYWGAGTERNTLQIIFNLLMGAEKSSQVLYAGNTGNNQQINAAVERDTADTYFPVTASQANSLDIGTCVSIGYAGVNSDGTLNKDIGVSSIHEYADNVRIIKKEALSDGNIAIYLDVETGFTTIPVVVKEATDSSEAITSPIILTTMYSLTGETDSVIGKHNGSAISNTNGRHSYRVQGVEYALGGYIVASDTVMDFQSDYSKNVYVAPKGLAHSSSEATIRSTYTLVGNIPASADGKGSVYWIGDIGINEETGCWIPISEGSGSAQGMGDRVYAGGTSTSGTREYLQGGNLRDGSSAGSSYLDCRNWLGGTVWYYCGCD